MYMLYGKAWSENRSCSWTGNFQKYKNHLWCCLFFCDTAEEFYMDEKLLQENDIRLKDAYREAENLLTSSEIIAIRSKYGISQIDFCPMGEGKS